MSQTSSWIVTALLGGGVPLLTAILTKAQSAAHKKAGLAVVLVAVAGVLTAIGSDGTTGFNKVATDIIVAFFAMASSYSNLWKPFKVVGPADQPGALDRVAPNLGV